MPVSTREGISLPEALEVEERSLPGGSRQLSLSGELDLATAPPLALALNRACACGSSVVLDLSGCSFLDSSGLALIVGAWHQFEEAPGDLELLIAGATGQVERLLRITGVSDHIRVTGSVAEAQAALR